MNIRDIEDEVRDWFAVVELASLELPGRWFGRPYDNFHRLSRSEVSGEEFLLELDDRLHLLIGGITSVEVTEMIFTIDADRIVFHWQEFGQSAEQQSEVYDGGGRLRLHAGSTRHGSFGQDT